MSAFRNADGTFASGGADPCRALLQGAGAKDKLRRVLTTPCNAKGDVLDAQGKPYTREDQAWAIKVMRERPEWALSTLLQCGV